MKEGQENTSPGLLSAGRGFYFLSFLGPAFLILHDLTLISLSNTWL